MIPRNDNMSLARVCKESCSSFTSHSAPALQHVHSSSGLAGCILAHVQRQMPWRSFCFLFLNDPITQWMREHTEPQIKGIQTINSVYKCIYMYIYIQIDIIVMLQIVVICRHYMLLFEHHIFTWKQNQWTCGFSLLPLYFSVQILQKLSDWIEAVRKGSRQPGVNRVF